MFCRHRRPSLLHLILLLLGVRSLKCCMDPEERQAFRAKRRLFRSKLRDAFSVWEEEPEVAPAPAQQEG